MGIRGLPPTLKCLLILKSSNKAVCRLSFVPARGKPIRGASGGLPEASDTPQCALSVHRRETQAQRGQHLSRGHTATPLGSWWPLEVPAWDQHHRTVPGGTRTPRRVPALQGWSGRPFADSGCPAPGLHPAFGGAPAGGRAPSGGRRGQKPEPAAPGLPRGGGDSGRELLLAEPPGLATALPFSTERKSVSGKTELL